MKQLKQRPIKNAEWWLNHSMVVLHSLYTAKHQAWVTNNMVSVRNDPNNSLQMRAGDESLLKIQCMVVSGSKVAVRLSDGEVWECALPDEAEELLPDDIAYISAQINAISQAMNAGEQAAFLASANAHAGENSILAK